MTSVWILLQILPQCLEQRLLLTAFWHDSGGMPAFLGPKASGALPSMGISF